MNVRVFIDKNNYIHVPFEGIMEQFVNNQSSCVRQFVEKEKVTDYMQPVTFLFFRLEYHVRIRLNLYLSINTIVIIFVRQYSDF